MNRPSREPRLWMAPLLTLAALSLLVASSPAQAQQARAARTWKAPSQWDDIELGVGLQGQVAGNFLDQPTNNTVSPDNPFRLVYPGFGGVGGGGGLSLEARWKKVVGLEIDLILSNDRGVGYIDLLQVSIGQTAWHLPILLQGFYPGEVVRPNLSFGVDIVIPQALRVETDPILPSTATLFGAQAGNYAMLMAEVGVEFLLPFDGIDLRVPLSLRGSLNPSTPSATRDRARYDLDGQIVRSVVFNSEWQYHVTVLLGLTWYPLSDR